MAAYTHERSGSRISYNGGSSREALPTGSCGFRDLNVGDRAPSCGCKRFWLNGTHFNGQDGASAAWCFCGHHACFHDAFSKPSGLGQVPLSAAMIPAPEAELSTQHVERTESQAQQVLPMGLGIRTGSSLHSQSINTRLWDALNAFARNQDDGAPQSDTTSNLPSTACPSVVGVGDGRASPSRVLLDGAQQRCMGPPVNIPHSDPNAASAEEYSATELATPSIRGTPDPQAFAVNGSHVRISPSSLHSAHPASAAGLNHLSGHSANNGKAAVTVGATQDCQGLRPGPASSDYGMAHLLQSLSRRVEVIEGLSFSHVPLEDVQDKFELMDGRLLDLEQWRTSSDQAHDTESAGPSKRRRLLPTEDGSFSSEGSFDSAAAAQAETAVLATLAANAETRPRIDALETRILDLENAALPSFARPWQVQVVLLPWGRSLRGVWFSALEATQHSLRSSTQASEEWSGAQSGPNISFRSSTSGAWTTESIRAWSTEAQPWMSPKACGPNGSVFQRLASRGLVRDIMLTAPDSCHLLGAVRRAFGSIPGEIGGDTVSDAQHQGLSEAFVPLRKVRKSSRLRFLSRAEMTTSATWTAGFLDASIFMKVNDGQRRLYLTAPDAYTQRNPNGWTWKSIRQLPLHDAIDGEEAAQAVSIESCWTYNDHLDQPLSTLTSFAASQHPSPSEKDTELALPESAMGHSRASSTSAEEHFRHKRTVSLPTSTSARSQDKAALPKRRVASFEEVSPTDLLPDLAASKRRRISMSPEAERRGVGFTPRMSREPQSPFASETAGEGQSQGNSSNRRGMTPFAYATPHSNSTFIGRVEGTEYSCGDTEADTDMAMPQSGQIDEDEWQGVDGADALDANESDMGEVEIDGESMHEGLTEEA